MGEENTSLKERYSRYTIRKIFFVILCILGAFSLFWLSVTIGTLVLSPEEVYSLIIRNITGAEIPAEEWYNNLVVWNYRVPRALIGIICGACLGVAGAVMQSVMKNPLADPYTTGVSSGALFGVALAAIMGFSIWKGGMMMSMTLIYALSLAIAPVLVIIFFASFFRKSPSSLILAGIAISYLFNSLTTLILVTTDSETLANVYSWQIGSFDGLGWSSIPMPLAITIIGMAITLPISKKLNLMTLDDSDAKSLGLDTDLLRTVCLLVVAVMAGTVICFVGIIGFIGLVIPHITRLILGSDNKFIIPASAALGAVFLLGCDVITRSMDIAAVLPVGVITGLIGAPIFLYLIISSKKGVW